MKAPTYAERILIEMDPASSASGVEDDLSVRAERDLQEILAAPTLPPATHHPRPRVKRIVQLGIVAAGLLVATVGLQALDRDSGSAIAATPAVLPTAHGPTHAGAADELNALADKVAGLPDETGDGDVALIRTQSWSLFTRVDGQQVTSEVVPTEATERITATQAANLGQPFRTLSPDVDVLKRQLAAGHQQQGPVGRMDAIVEAYLLEPIRPAVRAAMLRCLADADQIASVGQVTDRAGRAGLGFTLESDFSGLPTQYMAIFSPTTGTLLDYEETLTTDAGKLNVEPPAVINYYLWKDAHYTD